MKQRVLLDTGPVVALLKRQDQFHEWTKAEWATIQQPFLTCEAVIVEACFLMREIYRGQEAVLALLQRGAVQIPFCLDEETAALERLLTRSPDSQSCDRPLLVVPPRSPASFGEAGDLHP